MLSGNYLKVALRTFGRHRGYTLLNLFGLAVGMAACLVILLFIRNEHRFDAFHADADRIYRLNEVQSFPGITPQHVALSMYPMGPTMLEEFPEVEAFTRIADAPNVVTVEGELRTIETAARVDPAFFEMFDFPVLDGDAVEGLENPKAVVLTVSTAEALFGTADAVGRSMELGSGPYEVVAVAGDVPDASHLQFGALFSLRDVDDAEQMDNWGSNWLVTYLRLADGADPAALEAKFPEYVVRHMGEGGADSYELYLQSLADVHLASTHVTHDYRNWKKFDRQYVALFGILAAFVLAIAGINFMNLTTARSAARAKEVGVRKSIGAGRAQLAGQFLGESVLMAGLAFGLSIVLAAAALPFVNDLSRRSLSLAMLADPTLVAVVLGVVLIVGLLAGLYPALVLSAFEATRVLKGLLHRSGRKAPFRNALVVTQFAVAIALIVGTLLTMRQLDYMQNRDVGFDRAQIVVVPMSREANENYDAIRQELLRDPAIVGVTGSGQRLGNNLHQWGLRVESEAGEQTPMSVSNLHVDANFFDFYGIEIIEGRAFSAEREADVGRAFVVNEAFVAEMGWTEPIGKGIRLGWQDSLGSVVGVARDFNFNSLHHAVEPLAVSVQDWGYSEMSVRAAPGQAAEAVAGMDRVWTELVTDRPFDYTFLDQHFAFLYASDRQASRVVGIVALLAVLIACLGLFGLAAITTAQRTKEIGIRKVLGATVPRLVLLLSGEFVRLVGVAFLIAAPVAYVVMRGWLDGFAYRIPIGWEVFLFAGGLAVLVALATVGSRAARAARANPVEALRYE